MGLRVRDVIVIGVALLLAERCGWLTPPATRPRQQPAPAAARVAPGPATPVGRAQARPGGLALIQRAVEGVVAVATPPEPVHAPLVAPPPSPLALRLDGVDLRVILAPGLSGADVGRHLLIDISTGAPRYLVAPGLTTTTLQGELFVWNPRDVPPGVEQESRDLGAAGIVLELAAEAAEAIRAGIAASTVARGAPVVGVLGRTGGGAFAFTVAPVTGETEDPRVDEGQQADPLPAAEHQQNLTD